MILNQNPNLRTEDFQGQKEWAPKLFIQLNPFFQAVNQVINGGIDFSSNINSVTKDYSITTFQSFSISWPYTSAPNDLRVTKAYSGSQKTPTVILAAWDYDSTTKLVTVSKLYELTSNGAILITSGTYNFTVRVTI